MTDVIVLDLDHFEAERLEFAGTSDEVSLESLMGGQAMAEVAASCGPCSCSCCVVCCCCCCS
ncbi:hypothetical protein [Virgisporangium aurantiacum]|jgi:hypothetical protein|uniref:hypothetical protein n=1 Tax=Virgisporangium aurantiacum TaxID=175570 RepID=UPI0019523699|nr:hypothetical protein [Virgisporangium aurantiacum]